MYCLNHRGTLNRNHMGITDLSTQLRHAAQHGYAIGYFEAWDTYSLEAVLEAAEETASPAILCFGGAVANQAWLDRWGVEELATLARRLAEVSPRKRCTPGAA